MMAGGATTEVAVVAGGCFWCVQPIFERLRGVVAAECGYAGGHVTNPTYAQVCTGETGHAEAVRIEYDPAELSYAELLDVFLAVHNPTQLNRQGNDIGAQYRSAIFPQSAAQKVAAEAAIERARADWPEPIVTTLETMDDWYAAGPKHQQYFDRVGDQNPYCTLVINPKLQKFLHKYSDRVKSATVG